MNDSLTDIMSVDSLVAQTQMGLDIRDMRCHDERYDLLSINVHVSSQVPTNLRDATKSRVSITQVLHTSMTLHLGASDLNLHGFVQLSACIQDFSGRQYKVFQSYSLVFGYQSLGYSSINIIVLSVSHLEDVILTKYSCTLPIQNNPAHFPRGSGLYTRAHALATCVQVVRIVEMGLISPLLGLLVD